MEQSRNEVVVLVGRLAAEAQERAMSSGDTLLSWRLVVDRPPAKRPLPGGTRSPTVDTIDCVAWTSGVGRTAAGFSAGDLVSVEGSLRRRFWRAESGPVSRYEPEVMSANRLRWAA